MSTTLAKPAEMADRKWYVCLLYTSPLELRHRVDHVRVQHLAGGVHHGHLAAHAVAGVQTLLSLIHISTRCSTGCPSSR